MAIALQRRTSPPHTGRTPWHSTQRAEATQLLFAQPLLQRGDRREHAPLSDLQRDKFEDMLRRLSVERADICAAMAFAMDNAESGEGCVRCSCCALHAVLGCAAVAFAMDNEESGAHCTLCMLLFACCAELCCHGLCYGHAGPDAALCVLAACAEVDSACQH